MCVFCERTYFALGGIVLTHFKIVAPIRKDYVQLPRQYIGSQIRYSLQKRSVSD